jgi:hypothetical protein
MIGVNVSSALLAREFDTSALSRASLPQHEKAWVVRAVVEIDEHGNVTQVLLETRTADVELNAAVLSALYGSRARLNGPPCGGVVTISGSGRRPE